MKLCRIFVSLVLFISCTQKKEKDDAQFRLSIEQQLREHSQRHAEAEVTDDLAAFVEFYDERAISMPEYQLTLDGRRDIETFYKEIFNRQDIRSIILDSREFIHLDTTVVEIGTFIKEYSDSNNDSLVTLTGKYWHVWTVQPDRNFKIKGEAFGFFHSIENPESFIVDFNKKQPDDTDIVIQKEIPFELKAYNALMEKGVRQRDGILRAGFFTDDASVYPFADTTVTGIERIRPYLIAYSSRGVITIDSIMCYTYAFESINDYILEYDMFKVKWRRPDLSGRTEGKGIRIWKRQADHSLRLYREIGTHNYL